MRNAGIGIVILLLVGCAWTPNMRREQIERLKRAMTLEREAINQIKRALDARGTGIRRGRYVHVVHVVHIVHIVH